MFTITCHILFHRDEERLFIEAPVDAALNLKIRLLPGIRWSKTQKQWHLPLTEENYKEICKVMDGFAIIESNAVHDYFVKHPKAAAGVNAKAPVVAICTSVIHYKSPVAHSSLRISGINAHVMALFKRELVLKAYSASTIRTYSNEMMQFLSAIKNNSADDFNSDRIKNYQLYCFETARCFY